MGRNGTRASGRVRLLLACVLMLASCRGVPLGQEPVTCEVVISNPDGLFLTLERLDGGRIDLGIREHVALELEMARYVLIAGSLPHPLPLLQGVSPERGPMTLTVRAAVVAPSGFVHVPGGPTLIGDALGVGAPDERPARIVDVAGFHLARTETTNASYAAFLNALGRCDEDWIDLGGPKCGIHREASGRFVTATPDLPVVTVSLFGARAYCEWLTRSTGEVHRLPTEFEWQRAARGPRSSVYAYGDVHDPEAANAESGRLLPVASFPATGWGHHDLTGNAFEWTSSLHGEGLHVLKGGSHVLDGLYLRNAFRMWYRPLVLADDIGFRVLLEIP